MFVCVCGKMIDDGINSGKIRWIQYTIHTHLPAKQSGIIHFEYYLHNGITVITKQWQYLFTNLYASSDTSISNVIRSSLFPSIIAGVIQVNRKKHCRSAQAKESNHFGQNCCLTRHSIWKTIFLPTNVWKYRFQISFIRSAKFIFELISLKCSRTKQPVFMH